MLDLRWHKGEPTWEIIDELLEMIDASPSEEEIEARIQDARDASYDEGSGVSYNIGYKVGRSDGYEDGYAEGFIDGEGGR